MGVRVPPFAIPGVDCIVSQTAGKGFFMNPALKDRECLGRGFNHSPKKDVNYPALKERGFRNFDENYRTISYFPLSTIHQPTSWRFMPFLSVML